MHILNTAIAVRNLYLIDIYCFFMTIVLFLALIEWNILEDTEGKFIPIQVIHILPCRSAVSVSSALLCLDFQERRLRREGTY